MKRALTQPEENVLKIKDVIRMLNDLPCDTVGDLIEIKYTKRLLTKLMEIEIAR